jgi:hypothetical protein
MNNNIRFTRLTAKGIWRNGISNPGAANQMLPGPAITFMIGVERAARKTAKRVNF